MSLKNVALGALAYLIAVFPLAYVWHLVLFKNRFESMGYLGRAEPIIALGFLAILIQGVVISALFEAYRTPGYAFSDAFKICFPLMALIWTAQVLAHTAKFEVEIGPFVLLESGYFIVQAVLVSVLLGATYQFLISNG